MYNSYKIYSEYVQLLDNIHLYLLDNEVIEDENIISSADINWDKPSTEEFIVKVRLNRNTTRTVTVKVDKFNEYVNNGFKL